MKRIRLRTVVLLVVVAALGFGLQEYRRREAKRRGELDAVLAEQQAAAARFRSDVEQSYESFWPGDPSSARSTLHARKTLMTRDGPIVVKETSESGVATPGAPARNEPNPPTGPGRPD